MSFAPANEVMAYMDQREASKLMRAAKANPELTTDLDDNEAIKLGRQMWGNENIRGTQGTGENEWYTPTEYLEAAREVLGGFDLDPASSDAAQKIVKAQNYFTKSDDGLQKEWRLPLRFCRAL